MLPGVANRIVQVNNIGRCPYDGSVRLLSKSQNHVRYQSQYHRCNTQREPPIRHTQTRFLSTCSRRLFEPPAITFSDSGDAVFYTRDKSHAVKKPPAIRAQLQAWSSANAERKVQEAPDTIPSSGPISVLPQSIFLDPDQQVEKSEDVGDDWDGSVDDSSFEQMVGGLTNLSFTPGDLFTYEGSLQSRQLAIYIGVLGFQHLILLANGRWVCEEFPVRPLSWCFEGFASSEEVSQIREHLPKQPLERESHLALTESVPYFTELPPGVAEPVLRRIQKFSDEILDFRRRNEKWLDSMWEALADEKYFSLLPFTDVASRFTEQDTTVMGNAGGAAICMAAAKHPNIQLLHNTEGSLLQPAFLVSPKRLAATVDQVKDWIRQYQEAAAQATLGMDVTADLKNNPLTSFIEKARKRILESRKMRAPTTIGCLGPDLAHQSKDGKVETENNMTTFSEEDRMILTFLHDSCLREPKQPKLSQTALASLVLRAIGAYPKMLLTRQIGILLLQEMGLVAPWAERAQHNVMVPLPGRPGARQLTILAAEVRKEVGRLGLLQDALRNPLDDTLEDIREDLGNMEVFAVDPHTTKYPEDAISLEACAERPGLFWIHFHVTNIAAFFSPDHIFGKRARLATASWYSSMSTDHMISREINTLMALRPGTATLTFSCLMDEEGCLQDVQVKPTNVRNIIRLTHRGLAGAFGYQEPEQAYLVVGNDPDLNPQLKRESQADDVEREVQEARKYLPIFEKMESLFAARARRRLHDMPQHLKASYYDGRRIWKVNFDEDYNEDRIYKSCCYLGDPTISIEADRYQRERRANSLDETAPDTIQQAMILCNEVAAKWLADRKIPAIFEFLKVYDYFPLSKLENHSLTERALLPRHMFTVDPKPHIGLAISQYCKVTSPIRRFTDLINQWNIIAYLRAEADQLLKPGDPATAIDLPFAYDEIQKYITNESWVAAWSSRRDTITYEHWALQALFRAVHFGEAQLPEVWDIRVTGPKSMILRANKMLDHPDELNIHGVLVPFRVRCTVLRSEEGWENLAKKTMFLPVKIEVVDAKSLRILVRPVGPPSHAPTQTGKIELQSKLMTKNVKLKLEADRRGKEMTQQSNQQVSASTA